MLSQNCLWWLKSNQTSQNNKPTRLMHHHQVFNMPICEQLWCEQKRILLNNKRKHVCNMWKRSQILISQESTMSKKSLTALRLDTKNDGTFRWKNKLINHTKNYEFPSEQKKSIAKFHKIFLSNQKCNEDQHRKHCMLISRNIWFNRLKSPGNYFYSGFSLVAKMRLPWLQMPSMMLGLLVSSVLVARFAGLTYRWSTFIRNSYAVVPKMFQYLL